MLTAVIQACSPKKYFTEDENLLVSNTVVCDDPAIDVADPQSYIRQIPVRTILGIALHARIYNCVDPVKADSIRARNEARLEVINKQRKDKFLRKDLRVKDTIKKCKFVVDYYQGIASSGNLSEADSAGLADTISFWQSQVEKFQKKSDKISEKGYVEKSKLFSMPLFLQKIGEQPVKYKPQSTKKSAEQIGLYMKTKGYYESKVTCTEKIKNQNAYVTYSIEAGKPMKINNVTYSIYKDDTIQKYIFMDTSKCTFKTGDNLDIDLLSAERARITNSLKNVGYYRFSNDYVQYQVDTTIGGHLADITVEILPVTLDNGRTRRHIRSFISQVTVYPNFDNKEALQNPDTYFEDMDTSAIRPRDPSKGCVYFVSKEESSVKKYMIYKEIFIKHGDTYNQLNINNTYRHLTAFNVYKLVNIEFEPSSHRDSLNCNIFLTNSPLQSYSFEVDGTNSSGNIGGLSSLTYQHKNIFHGAESFDLKFSLALESQTGLAESESGFSLNTQEYSLDSRLYFPRLLAPKKLRRLARNNTPKTYLSMGFSYRSRPDYTRTQMNGSFYYQWSVGKYASNTITPIRLSSIRITDTDSAFVAWLNRLYIKDSYQDHFILGSSYSYTFNNQGNGKRMYNLVKLNLSWAGNLLHLIDKWAGASKNEAGSYTIPLLGTTYAQFVKADIDFRHYIKTVGTNTVVFRAYAGIGLPYGNISSMPFTEQYFSGGANSLRAWQIRSVGPGSYVNDEQDGLVAKYPNMTSDMKLESNLEYRFKIFWVVEGAWFVDAGNIWSINQDDKRQGGNFAFKRFLKEIAVGTGFGLRLDFDFFIFRTDFGLKLHDPALPENRRWVFQDDNKFMFHSRNWEFNLGIGYPF